MRVVDCHRILGPIPVLPGNEDPSAVIEELDRMHIAAAAVVRAWELYGDPVGAQDYLHERGSWAQETRLLEVPVVIPGPAHNRWPLSQDELEQAPLVRACPGRHRFDLAGAAARELWDGLAHRGTVLSIDMSEVGLAGLATIAAAKPNLKLLALSPGYRELRRLTELMQAHPQIHVETGTIVTAGGVEWLARAVGAHRLLFGTGAPLWDAAGPRFQLDHLDLPAADVELIAHGSWDLLTGGLT